MVIKIIITKFPCISYTTYRLYFTNYKTPNFIGIFCARCPAGRTAGAGAQRARSEQRTPKGTADAQRRGAQKDTTINTMQAKTPIFVQPKIHPMNKFYTLLFTLFVGLASLAPAHAQVVDALALRKMVGPDGKFIPAQKESIIELLATNAGMPGASAEAVITAYESAKNSIITSSYMISFLMQCQCKIVHGAPANGYKMCTHLKFQDLKTPKSNLVIQLEFGI